MIRFLKNHWLKIIGAGLIVFIAFSIISGRRQAELESQETYYNPKKDSLVVPKMSGIKDEITLAGSVAASEVATLRFQNAGKLVWVGVKEGDTVKKWQAIASLDRELLRKSLATQFNNYQTQLSQFLDTQDNYQETRDKALVTDTIQRILDRTQYSLDNSVIQYEISDMAIKEASLVSPINGVVVNIEQPLTGTNITPANSSFTIINPASVYFKTEIDQEDVTRLRLGQTAVISIDSFPDINLDSQVTFISFTPITGQASTVYEVRLKLPVDNSDFQFRLGMDGDATVLIKETAQTLVIPLETIYDDNGKSYVLIKTGNALERRYVTVGIETDETVEILEGLTTNDSVAIKNY